MEATNGCACEQCAQWDQAKADEAAMRKRDNELAALGHDFQREAGVEISARTLRAWAEELRGPGVRGGDFIADKLENYAGGSTIAGWEFTCARCGSTPDPFTREPCPHR